MEAFTDLCRTPETVTMTSGLQSTGHSGYKPVTDHDGKKAVDHL